MMKLGAILAGGASRRMGRDKASLLIDGRSLGLKIAGELESAGYEPVTLGGTPLPGCRFIPDREAGSGPLSALRGFTPDEGLVFLASCDLPLFSCVAPTALESLLVHHQAVIPMIDGRPQPLCALYRSSCWQSLVNQPKLSRVMDWTAGLDAIYPAEEALREAGADPRQFQSANTPEELQALLALGE